MTRDGRDLAIVLVRLGSEAGGRVDPARIARRPPGADSRIAFEEAQRVGWLDLDGWITPEGWEAVS